MTDQSKAKHPLMIPKFPGSENFKKESFNPISNQQKVDFSIPTSNPPLTAQGSLFGNIKLTDSATGTGLFGAIGGPTRTAESTGFFPAGVKAGTGSGGPLAGATSLFGAKLQDNPFGKKSNHEDKSKSPSPQKSILKTTTVQSSTNKVESKDKAVSFLPKTEQSSTTKTVSNVSQQKPDLSNKSIFNRKKESIDQESIQQLSRKSPNIDKALLSVASKAGQKKKETVGVVEKPESKQSKYMPSIMQNNMQKTVKVEESQPAISFKMPQLSQQSVQFDPQIKIETSQKQQTKPVLKFHPSNVQNEAPNAAEKVEKKSSVDAPVAEKAPANEQITTQKVDLKGYPVGINNHHILTKVANHQPLSNEQTQKITSNFVFYVRDRRLKAEFQNFKKANQTLKLKILQTHPSKKSLSTFFLKIIEQACVTLKTNPFAALDILTIYLSEQSNWKQFSDPKIMQIMKQNGVIQAAQQADPIKILTQKPLIQKILHQLTHIFKQQQKQLVSIFLKSAKVENKIFKAESMLRSCYQNLWDSFQYYYQLSSSQNQQRLTSILQIFTSLLVQYKLTINPNMITQILQTLDACLVKKEISRDIAVNFAIKLLKFDLVNSLLKQTHVENSINVFDTKHKQVRNCLVSLKSKQFLPFKVVIPAIDKTLRSKENCVNLEQEPESDTSTFGDKQQDILNAPYWLDWLQLWIQVIKDSKYKNPNHMVTALECLRNNLTVQYAAFWLHFTSPRFINSKWLIWQSVQRDIYKEVFQVLEAAVGEKNVQYANLAYGFALETIEKEGFVELMRRIIGGSGIEEASESCVNFVCKLIVSSPDIYKTIERDIFGHEGQGGGVIVKYFMEVISRVDPRQRIICKILEVFNHLFQCDPQVFLQQLKQFQLCYDNDYDLNFFQNTRNLVQNKLLFYNLCQHLNLLISYPKSLTILGDSSKWLSKFKTLQPWKIRNSDSIKCIKFMLISWSLNQNSYWSSTLKKIDVNDIYRPIIDHRYEKKKNNGTFTNQIIADFLTYGHKAAEDIKVLTQTLALLQTGITLLEKNKIRFGKNQIATLPLLSHILHLFIYNINEDEFVESGWFKTKKLLHPYLIFIEMFNLSEDKIERIRSVTGKNIAEIAINILSRLIKMNYSEENDKEESMLYKLLTKAKYDELEQNGKQPTIGDKNTFIESLRLKLESKFIVENIIQLLVYMSYSEKILVSYIFQKLKTEFLNIFIWALQSENMILKTRTHILLLHLIERASKNSTFLKLAFSHTSFWLALTTPHQLPSHYKNKSFLGQAGKIKRNTNENTMKYFHQTLLRFGFIFNSIQIYLTMIKDYPVVDFKVYATSFFQLFNSSNIEMLFKNVQTFREDLLVKQGETFRYVPASVSKDINNFILNFESYYDDYNTVFSIISNANTLAYSNIFKLYMSVINPSRILPISKHLLDSNDNERMMIGVILNFLSWIVAEKNKYPTYFYYMMAVTITATGSNAYPLIKELERDMKWFQFVDAEEYEATFFLLQALADSQFKKVNLESSVRVILDNAKFITEKGLALATSSGTSLHKKIIEQLPFLINNLPMFGMCCQYLIKSYYEKQAENKIATSSKNLSSLLLVKSITQTLSNLSDRVEQLPLYVNSSRNKDHLIWCWCLVLAKTITAYDNGDYMISLHHVIVRRIQKVLSEAKLANRRIVTRAFKEELQYITDYFAALVISGSELAQQEIKVVYRLWKDFSLEIIKMKPQGITEFEISMSTVFDVESIGGLYSYRSVSPLTPQSIHNRKESIQENLAATKPKVIKQLEVNPLELESEFLNYNIIYNVVGFCKRYYKSLNLQHPDHRSEFQNMLDKTLWRVLEFFQQTYGVVGVSQVFKTLNLTLISEPSSKETAGLSNLIPKLEVEDLSDGAMEIIHVLVDLYLLHLGFLGELVEDGVGGVKRELGQYCLKIEKISKKLSEFKALVEDGMALYNGLMDSRAYKLKGRRDGGKEQRKFSVTGLY